ncbi:hypothetical protein PROFUN_09038 [Planoprotostelium fungivorum]|uniref:Uncharacterized protein n=1 Tax=Planoprotostelium fungivorum TaxID=1890364 RepID=A0A2P6MV11_9EUKA|nr:hypothetical protein PROFUN_09038 [Planoprotostelium fungivorum]
MSLRCAQIIQFRTKITALPRPVNIKRAPVRFNTISRGAPIFEPGKDGEMKKETVEKYNEMSKEAEGAAQDKKSFYNYPGEQNVKNMSKGGEKTAKEMKQEEERDPGRLEKKDTLNTV